MPEWITPTFWLCMVPLCILSAIWGFLERRVQLLNHGYYNPRLGWEKSNIYTRIPQGIVSLLIFLIMGACFWLLGWKIGIGAILLSLAIGSMTS